MAWPGANSAAKSPMTRVPKAKACSASFSGVFLLSGKAKKEEGTGARRESHVLSRYNMIMIMYVLCNNVVIIRSDEVLRYPRTRLLAEY